MPNYVTMFPICISLLFNDNLYMSEDSSGEKVGRILHLGTLNWSLLFFWKSSAKLFKITDLAKVFVILSMSSAKAIGG